MNNQVDVFIMGLGGAIATTLIAGVSAREFGGDPDLGTLTLSESWKALSLPSLTQLNFVGWDVVGEDLYVRALKHRVLSEGLIEKVASELRSYKVMPSILRATDVLSGDLDTLKPNITKLTAREALNHFQDCIETQRSRSNSKIGIVVNLASTERYNEALLEVSTGNELSEMIDRDDERITTGVILALAAMRSRCAFIDFTPGMTLECPAVQNLSQEYGVPIMGKDGSTGQTLIKTVLAEMFVRRNLSIRGWYSTNILGNNDGRVLTMPAHKKTKMRDKLDPLKKILRREDFEHVVDISYFRRRGDKKEAWDVVDFAGWLGTEMSLRLNWQGIDSILAAPLLIDLIRLSSLDLETGFKGVAQHLAYFFKHPLRSESYSFFTNIRKLHDHYGVLMSEL